MVQGIPRAQDSRRAAALVRTAAATLWLCAIAAALGVVGPAMRHGVAPAAAAKRREPAPTVVYSLWLRNDLDPPRILVTMLVPVPAGDRPVSVEMPAWSPGDYKLQNHGRFVQEFRAAAMNGSSQTVELPVRHGDPSIWQIEPRGADTILVSYSVPQTPPGNFSDNVTIGQHYAFVNGPAALAYVAGHKDWKTALYVYLPRAWRAEIALPQVENATSAATEAVSAPDYDTLADSPIVAADPEGATVRQFEVDGKPHRMVFFDRPPTPDDASACVPTFKAIVQAENDIMGGPPYDRYDFMLDVGGTGGGLEHLNSARLRMAPSDSPRDYKSFVAHEFFHLWNVKRIRPAVLGPFDYVHPPKTRNLWFAEGVTEYYARFAVRRAGLSTEAELLRHFRNMISRMESNLARKRVTAEEASLHVWETSDSEGYGGLSYYDKGELIGLCLDLKLRHATRGAKSLDDVMRLLMARHNPPKPGYGEDEIRATVSEVAGQDLSAFYDLLARSTQEMPFEQCLGYAGLDSELRPQPGATADQVALRRAWTAGPANGGR
jgi:predicted metalloprotease with PDZ domain